MNRKPVTPFDPEYIPQIKPFKNVTAKPVLLTQPPRNSLANIATENHRGKIARLLGGSKI